MELFCPSCNTSALHIKKAVYDGFTKTGEVLTCTACGHERPMAEQEAPLPASPKPSIFSEDDVPEIFKIDGQDEQVETCRHCEHYVANPFTQRCSLHKKEVQATDSCGQFVRGKDESTDLL